MKKKGIPLIVALLCLVVLSLGYVWLVHYNKEQEKKEQKEDTIPVLSLKASDIEKISYTLDGQEITFTRSGDGWIVDSDATFPVDTDKIESLLSTITEMTATRKMTDVESLSDYGLDTPVQTVTLTDSDGNVTTLCFGSNNATTGDDYLYDKSDDKTVYTVAASVQSSLSGTLEDFRATEEETTEADSENE